MRYLFTDNTCDMNRLKPYPGNARVHDDAALDESIKLNGQYRAVIARKHPSDDDAFQILAGHGTTAALRRAGDKTLRVEVIEADDTEARRIVLADNATSRNASYDDALLLSLLDAASTDGGLSGTGWDSEAYAALVQDPQLPEEGDADQYDDEHDQFAIIVECASERQQLDLLSRFDAEGIPCRAMFQ